jgi:hypothetical protein
MLVAHAFNPNLLGGGGEKIRRIVVQSQPGQIVSETQKRASGVARGVGPEFKPLFDEILLKYQVPTLHTC